MLGTASWLGLLAGLRLGLRRLLVSAVSAAVGDHLFVLLFLRVVQQGFNLDLAVLLDGLHFGVAIFWSQRSVGLKCLDLLLAVGQDGLDLGDLIAVEAKLFAQVCGLLVRIHRVARPCLLRRLGCGLGRGCGRGLWGLAWVSLLRQACSCGEDGA